MVRRLIIASVACVTFMFSAWSAAQEIDAANDTTTTIQDTQASTGMPPLSMDTTAVDASTAPTVAARLEGALSYYGSEFNGRRTSSGESFDPARFTMAHLTLPFGTLVRVTNLRNNKSVIVRVNDRGPHTGGRIGDVSAAAATVLDMLRAGIVRARLEVLGARASP